MTRIRINVDAEIGKEKLSRLKELFTGNVLLDTIAARLQAWMDAHFASGGRGDPDAPSGTEWRPIAPLTALISGGSRTPLRKTGSFQGAFQVIPQYGTGRVEAGWPSEMQWLARLLNDGCGPIHATGKALKINGPSGPIFLKSTSGIPARELLPSEAVARRMIVDTLEAALQRAISAIG